MVAKFSTTLCLVAATLMLIQMNGCSIVGFGIGSIIDAKKADTGTISPEEVKVIQPGSKIVITLRDGTEIGGRYRGIEELSPQAYGRRYTKRREEWGSEIYLPAIGDTITIITESGRQCVGEFLGFDHKIACVKLLDRSGSTSTNLNIIETIEDDRGNVVSGLRLKQFVFDGKIPFQSAIAIDATWTKTLIALDEVHQIQIPVKKRGGELGGCVFPAVVAVILFALLVSSDLPLGYMD